MLKNVKTFIACALCAASLISLSACSSGGTDNSAASDTASSGENGNAGVSAVNDPEKSIEGNIGDVSLKKGDKYAVITIKDYGDITVKLFPDAAPKGVANFISLAESGFYSGKVFHRIIADFMAQGGQAKSADEDVEQFGIETNYNMRHFYGAFCYANAMGNNTTQFYIVNCKKPQDLDDLSVARIENNITTYEGMAASCEKGSDMYNYYMFQADYYRTIKVFLEKADDAVKEKYKQVGGTPSLDGNYTVFGQTVDGFDVLDKISSVEVEANLNMNGEVSKPVNDVIIESVVIKEYSE